MREHSYQDQNGQQKVFVTKGFVVTNGINRFFAEATGEYARALEQKKPELHTPYMMSIELSCREWMDQQQQRRFENGIRIVKLAKL